VQAPKLGPLNCTPSFPHTGDTITCSATYDPTIPPTSYSWSAPNGNPSSGSSSSFATVFSSTGTQTITLSACNGPACTLQSQPFVLSAAAQAPTLGPITCSPSAPHAGDTVACSVTNDPNTPPTSYSWSAPNGG